MVFSEWHNNRKWMKITDDIESFPGIPPHFGGVMSDGDKLLESIPDYAEACFGVDTCPASGGGGRSAAAPGLRESCGCDGFGRSGNTSPSFPAVDPAAPIRGVDRAVTQDRSRP